MRSNSLKHDRIRTYTVPDVEEYVVDVEDGMQPVPRPRTPVQSVVVNEDDAEVV